MLLSIATIHFSVHLSVRAFFFLPCLFTWIFFLLCIFGLNYPTKYYQWHNSVEKKAYKFMLRVSGQVVKSSDLCMASIAFVYSPILALIDIHLFFPACSNKVLGTNIPHAFRTKTSNKYKWVWHNIFLPKSSVVYLWAAPTACQTRRMWQL